MSKFIGAITTVALTATADAATTLTDATYPFCLQGGTATQSNAIQEIYSGGQATSSSPVIMLLGMNSTAGGTLSKGTGLTSAPMNAQAGVLTAPAVIYNTTTTKPQRSTTLHLLNLTFNAFGGVVRWLAAPGEEVVIYGASASIGDVSYSAFTGSTASAPIGAHIIYETL
jgi:hypothetical protein